MRVIWGIVDSATTLFYGAVDLVTAHSLYRLNEYTKDVPYFPQFPGTSPPVQNLRDVSRDTTSLLMLIAGIRMGRALQAKYGLPADVVKTQEELPKIQKQTPKPTDDFLVRRKLNPELGSAGWMSDLAEWIDQKFFNGKKLLPPAERPTTQTNPSRLLPPSEQPQPKLLNRYVVGEFKAKYGQRFEQLANDPIIGKQFLDYVREYPEYAKDIFEEELDGVIHEVSSQGLLDPASILKLTPREAAQYIIEYVDAYKELIENEGFRELLQTDKEGAISLIKAKQQVYKKGFNPETYAHISSWQDAALVAKLNEEVPGAVWSLQRMCSKLQLINLLKKQFTQTRDFIAAYLNIHDLITKNNPDFKITIVEVDSGDGAGFTFRAIAEKIPENKAHLLAPFERCLNEMPGFGKMVASGEYSISHILNILEKLGPDKFIEGAKKAIEVFGNDGLYLFLKFSQEFGEANADLLIKGDPKILDLYQTEVDRSSAFGAGFGVFKFALRLKYLEGVSLGECLDISSIANELSHQSISIDRLLRDGKIKFSDIVKAFREGGRDKLIEYIKGNAN